MRAVSLFTGAGGLDIGFQRAGFEVVFANDIDKDACKTFEKNSGSVIFCDDLSNLYDEIKSLKNIDIVFGGPPCQGFSVAGKMDLNDERSKLVNNFMDVVEMTKPQAFVMENVKSLATLKKFEEVKHGLIRRAHSLGFSFAHFYVLNATDFDVPQKRERMFFVGLKNHSKLTELSFEERLNSLKKKPKFAGDIIRKLGRAGTGNNTRVCKAKITLAARPVLRKSPYSGMLFNGAGRPINPEDYSNTLPASMGGNRTPIIDEKHYFEGGKSWIEEYHDYLLNGGKAEFGDAPRQLRRLTVDEAIQIQTFPTDYEFVGTQSSVYKQIGNSVPPNLAQAVASVVKDVTF